jgi:hypothetical protein
MVERCQGLLDVREGEGVDVESVWVELAMGRFLMAHGGNLRY